MNVIKHKGQVFERLTTDLVSITAVKSSPHKLKWEMASQTEVGNGNRCKLKPLKSNRVWEFLELPPNRETRKWKMNDDGTLEFCKSRLVAQGLIGGTHKFRLDYEGTYILVFCFESNKC